MNGNKCDKCGNALPGTSEWMESKSEQWLEMRKRLGVESKEVGK